MEVLKCRARIAVLWLIKSLAYCGNIFLHVLLKPGALTDLMAGIPGGSERTEASNIMLYSITFWIPSIMAWAVMTLNLTFNRWANTILGVILGFAILIITINTFSTLTSTALIQNILGIICFFLIAWYGWKLPKNED